MYKESETGNYEEPEVYRSMTSLWPKWHSQAACLGQDQRMFFGSAQPEERPAYTKTDIRKAKQTCMGCPVFETCLRTALFNHEIYGVWAGTTMRERMRYYREIALGFYTMDEVIESILTMRNQNA